MHPGRAWRLRLFMNFLWRFNSFRLESLLADAREVAAQTVSVPMLDFILIAVGCGLFVVGIAYVYACDRL